MVVDVGDTFLFDPEERNQPHLWVVLNVYQPEFETIDYAILVHVTTLTPRTHDLHKVCILEPTDSDCHPFIHTPSYVLYEKVMVVECSRLFGQKTHDQASPALLSRMRQGLHKSKLTPKRFKALVPHD